MKNLLIALFILSGLFAHAQEEPSKKNNPVFGGEHRDNRIQVFGGPSFCKVFSDGTSLGDRFKIGLNVGAVFEHRSTVSHKLAGIGLIYSVRGISQNIQYTDQFGQTVGTGVTNLSFRYLTLPLTYGLHFGDKVKWSSRIGLLPSYSLGASYSFPTGPGNQNESLNINEWMKKFDFALSLETGIELAANDKLGMSFHIGATKSLTNYSASGSKATQFNFSSNMGMYIKL